MIKVVCVGKIKEKFLTSAVNEYLKRLSKYTKINVIQIPDVSSVEKALKIEGEKILSKIKDDEYVIALDIDGEKLYNQQQRIQLRRGTRLVTGGAF